MAKLEISDLKSPKVMWLKAGLFAVIGSAAGILLLMESPGWRTGLLLALAIWACCRAYYFVFYVISRYIDPAYKFSGLGSFVVYMLRKRRKP